MLPQTIPLLGWAWDDLIFLLLAGILLGGALLTVLGRDIIRSGLFMMSSFAALAGIYVLLGTPLVAAAQVLIYIGAISVLVLFAIMLTQSKVGPAKLVFHHQAWAGALAAVILALLLGGMVVGTTWPQAGSDRSATPTDLIARLLFSDYWLLPLEIIGLLLVAAVVGGVFLAKREDTTNPVTRATAVTGSGFGPAGATATTGGGIGSASGAPRDTLRTAADAGRGAVPGDAR